MATKLRIAMIPGVLLAAGCASPGPPRAPSLRLPEPVSDLAAKRVGNSVELSFTVPQRSTDRLPLHDRHNPHSMVRGLICREIDHAACVALSAIEVEPGSANHTSFLWKDVLPEPLTQGVPHLISYRVELLNAAGRSAGRSEAAYTASGPSPAPVEGLQARGIRAGILLSWKPAAAAGEVLLHRVELPSGLAPNQAATLAANKSRRSGDSWLTASAETAGQNGRTLDATVMKEVPYRYVAMRQQLVTFGTRTVDIRSVPSKAVEITLLPIYPPSAPSGLAAASAPAPQFAVDLVWQPVSEAGITDALAAPMAGYNVYRETVGSAGQGATVKLTPKPVTAPSFHDETAEQGVRYRYRVTAIDSKGNESNAAMVALEPSPL